MIVPCLEPPQLSSSKGISTVDEMDLSQQQTLLLHYREAAFRNYMCSLQQALNPISTMPTSVPAPVTSAFSRTQHLNSSLGSPVVQSPPLLPTPQQNPQLLAVIRQNPQFLAAFNQNPQIVSALFEQHHHQQMQQQLQQQLDAHQQLQQQRRPSVLTQTLPSPVNKLESPTTGPSIEQLNHLHTAATQLAQLQYMAIQQDAQTEAKNDDIKLLYEVKDIRQTREYVISLPSSKWETESCAPSSDAPSTLTKVLSLPTPDATPSPSTSISEFCIFYVLFCLDFLFCFFGFYLFLISCFSNFPR